jgi:hypothetical protein
MIKIKDVYNSDEEYSVGEKNLFGNSLRIDNELFKEEDNIVYSLMQVRKINKSKNGESWQILQDRKVVLVLKAEYFDDKELQFLKTPKGFLYLIDGYKKGWREMSEFKDGICDNL